MTKEQFEDKFEDAYENSTSATEGGYGPDSTDKWGMCKALYPTVELFAKEQAITFDIWKLKNHWVWDSSRLHYFKWEGDNMKETRLSHEEIYCKFIESQSTNNKE